eukprot:s1628_g10.t1
MPTRSFDLKPSLEDEMSSASLVISHAGAGSIIEALRQKRRLLVVVNPALMDNHQLEAMHQRGHCAMAAEPKQLQSALAEAAKALSNFGAMASLAHVFPLQRLCIARCASRLAQTRAFSLLEQLPDYAAGSKALAEKRFSEALPMLKRAVEVADAYFPADAGAELVECHASLGSCLWYIGQYEEAARVMSKSSSDHLLLGAALILFELGRFEEADGAHTAQKKNPQTCATKLTSSLAADVKDISADGLTGEFAAMMKLNQLISFAQSSAAEPGPDTDVTALQDLAHISWLENALKDILRELDELDALKPDADLMLRCTVGELAVMAGLKDEWVRESLVKTLKDFDRLQPKDPSGQAIVFRALTALATLTNAAGDAITAEGLFHSAQDHVARHTAPGRAAVWRRGVANAFATMLETGRHAEKRAPEIKRLREAAGAAASASQKRWALLVLPQPLASKA